MATTIIKGRIDEVRPVTYVGEKKTALQTIEVFVPGYNDGFEQVGRDSRFELQALGKKVADLNLAPSLVGKKAILKCYVDSQYVEPKEAGQNGFYSVNLTINNIEIIS